MAKVYREVRKGEMEHDRGSELAYILAMIGKQIEAADIEKP